MRRSKCHLIKGISNRCRNSLLMTLFLHRRVRQKNTPINNTNSSNTCKKTTSSTNNMRRKISINSSSRNKIKIKFTRNNSRYIIKMSPQMTNMSKYNQTNTSKNCRTKSNMSKMMMKMTRRKSRYLTGTRSIR